VIIYTRSMKELQIRFGDEINEVFWLRYVTNTSCLVEVGA
jgi:hypothetical protein